MANSTVPVDYEQRRLASRVQERTGTRKKGGAKSQFEEELPTNPGSLTFHGRDRFQISRENFFSCLSSSLA